VNVRLIAATNRSLREQVAAQKFRSDLYYRLAVVEVKLPPLRERLPICRCWSSTSCATSAPSTTRPGDVRSTGFLGALAEHSWPGNIRELRNYLERCVALHDFAPPRGAGTLRPSRPEAPSTSASRCARRARPGSARSNVATWKSCCAQHENRVSAAARAAGVDRIYFYRLLWKHGLRQREAAQAPVNDDV
jgi:DNA-binding NtrC family response regulator